MSTITYIPNKQEIIGYEEALGNLDYAVKKGIPTLLIGETGVGKTSLIRHLAHKNQQGFRRLNLNGQTTIDEFVGKTLLNKEGTYWQDGVLTEALRNGYWLVLDELNAALPEILFVLHSLLDDDNYIVLSDKDGEIVNPHKDFRIFATMNPSGKYAGTKELNKALLSRFPMILQIDFPTFDQEVNILRHYSTLAKKDIQHLVKMAGDIRQSYKKEETEFVLSTRDLINCSVIAQDLGITRAITLNVLNRCNEEDKKAVSTIIKLYFGEGVTRSELDPARDAAHKVIKSYIPMFEGFKNKLDKSIDKVTSTHAFISENIKSSNPKHVAKIGELISDLALTQSMLRQQQASLTEIIQISKQKTLSSKSSTAALLKATDITKALNITASSSL